MVIAYSYLRFSSPEQAKGDSLRRQQELRDAWIKRNGARLDTSLRLRDEGVSAFRGGHRDNPDRHALAAFLELVRAGQVERGSFLIVESLDRLSREHIRPALTLLLNLIESGVRVVQLLPSEVIYDEAVEPMTLMMGIMELSRGHSESEMKSQRVGRAWQHKKREAGQAGPITARCPAWLNVEGGKFIVDKSKAAAIRRIFKLAVEGLGIGAITTKLNVEGVPPIATATYWARSYVAKLLNNPAVHGEYQPHTRRGGRRRPDGKAIANYFPVIIPEADYHAARAAMQSRKLKGGRPSGRMNLFAGLLRDAVNGGNMHVRDKGKKSSGPAIVSYRGLVRAHGAKPVSFPLAAFEWAILSKLREIDPREIMPDQSGSADQVKVLTGRLADIDSRIVKVKAQLIGGGDVGSLADVLRTLDGKRKVIAAELSQAKQAASAPLDAAWGAGRSMIDSLVRAKDQQAARQRLRAALRRTIEGVYVVIVANGSIRIAAARMQFVGGEHRDYLIVHHAGHANAASKRESRTEVKSFSETLDGEFDLRDRRKARQIMGLLKSIAK